MTGDQALKEMGLSEKNATGSARTSSRTRPIIYPVITSKGYTRHGVKHEGRILEGHQAEVLPGKYIKLHGTESNHVNGPQTFNKCFRLGDSAEYDSYNLRYTGKIVKIGPKTITIEAYPGTHNAERHQLDLHTFSWRNWKFNLDKINKYNAEESMCI